MRSVDVITMGCSKNLVDSEKLMFQLERNGFAVYHNPSRLHHDIAVVNTCGFINDAKEESIQMILQLCEAKERGRLNKIYVIGCLSERFFKDLYREIPQVDQYYGKFNYQELISELSGIIDKDQSFRRTLTTPKHYAYVKISEGCDRKCAYCAIPIITGRHKSLPMESIVREVEDLVSKGVKEIQLIAQELTYYGLDLYGKRRIAELVERISDIKGVEWIRLHYGYPNQFPLELLKVMRERDNVCKYIDIALQHVNDVVLSNMQRHTSKEYQRELLLQMREEVPELCVRSTFMVGFPGEGEKEFEELLEFTRWAKFDRMGAFKYSEEEGTYAALHYEDRVPEEIKEQRLSKLMAVQQDISTTLNAQKVGKTLKTIIDRKEGDFYVGRTEFDSPEVDGEVIIKSEGNRLRIGDFYHIQITDSDEFDLYGKVCKL